MYLPNLHEERDLGVLHALISAHPLGTWATLGDDGIIMNHVPFILDPARGEFGTLMCHVSRANTVWQRFSRTVESVIAFQGAEAYISPSWYASKALHGKVVPTWNYAVVHAHGIPEVLADESRLLAHLAQLTDAHETGRPDPWHVGDAPADFIRHMSQQIVGIEIPIARIVGKWKVSQNRSPEDRRGVVAGLTQNGDARSAEMADAVAHAMRDKSAD
jgi:transcriptional regulator